MTQKTAAGALVLRGEARRIRSLLLSSLWGPDDLISLFGETRLSGSALGQPGSGFKHGACIPLPPAARCARAGYALRGQGSDLANPRMILGLPMTNPRIILGLVMGNPRIAQDGPVSLILTSKPDRKQGSLKPSALSGLASH